MPTNIYQAKIRADQMVSTLKPRTGTTAAGTEPIQMTSGSVLTSPEAGAVEFTTDDFFATITTGPARKNIVLWDTLGTSVRMPYTTTNGRLLTTSSADDIILPVVAGKTVVLENIVYKDIWTGIMAERSSGVTLTTSIGTMQDYTMNVNGYFDLPANELQHDYKEGTNVEIHAHLLTNGLDATDRFIQYTVEYSWTDINGVSSSASFNTGDLKIPASTTDKTHLYFSLGTLTGTGHHIGSQLKVKITRIAASGTAPANPPYVLAFGCHYQVDTMGSRTISSK